MNQNFKNLLTLFMILNISLIKAQQQSSFTITPELSQKVITAREDIKNVKVYRVITKEVDYYPIVDGEVITNEYRIALDYLKDYKPAYDDYVKAIAYNTEKTEAIKTVSSKIDSFLNSDEKRDVKEKYLIEGQDLANKYEIKVVLESGNINIGNRKIFLYNNGNIASKSDLKTYQKIINDIRIIEPEKSWECQQYIAREKNLLNIQKTEIGKILSDKLSKKSIYMIEESPIDVNMLSGEFKMLNEKYVVITNEVTGKLFKNELVNESTEHYKRDRFYDFKGFPIIQNVITNELYFITSEYYALALESKQLVKNYETTGTNPQYIAWKTKYIGLLQSAQININACKAITAKHTFKNMLGEKRYDSGDFSATEKSTFNKNLDLLEAKLKQIRELESKQDFYGYYNDKVSEIDATKSYSISSYFNSTSRVY